MQLLLGLEIDAPPEQKDLADELQTDQSLLCGYKEWAVDAPEEYFDSIEPESRSPECVHGQNAHLPQKEALLRHRQQVLAGRPVVRLKYQYECGIHSHTDADHNRSLPEDGSDGCVN